MRLQKLRYLLNQSFDNYFECGKLDVSPYLLRGMKKWCDKFSKDEGDYRSGEDTYGYTDNEAVQNDLLYISDRWRCAFRLRWLIEGIEKGYIK